MDKVIEYINSKTQNKYSNIKLSNVIYNKQSSVAAFKFVYNPSSFDLNDADRQTLKELILEHLKEGGITTNVEVFTKKAILDADVLKDIVYKFLNKNYYSIYSNFSKNSVVVDNKNEIVNVALELSEVYFNFLSNRNFEQELTETLNDNFFTTFNVELIKVEQQEENENILQKRFEQVANYKEQETKPIIKYTVNNVEPFIGEIITDKATLIEDLKQPTTGVVIAGNVKFITKKSFVSKRKNENGENQQKEYYSFSVFDESGNMACVMFLSQTDLPKMEELKENSFIVVFGDVEKFNEKLNFKVKRISYGQSANIEKPEVKVAIKKVNDNYLFVKPEPYIMLEQSNLFALDDKPVNSFLQNNELVVFDFETTGLESTVCEIIEIGAVKVINGKISETFSCLVKPKKAISEEITGITGITNDMVADAYSIEQVLQDFYKFTYNCVLSAYNIAFDYNFLYAASKKQGFVFDNRQIDSMFLAKTKLPGLKNYKLKTVATALNINLDNAHRAVYDAIATAEVFIKLSDGLK